MSESFSKIDFEIAKKELARNVALLVGAFVDEYELGNIDVSVFLTDADVALTQKGNIEYGRMLHCVVDADIDSKEEDYE